MKPALTETCKLTEHIALTVIRKTSLLCAYCTIRLDIPTCRCMDTASSRMGSEQNCCTLRRALTLMCQAGASHTADSCSDYGTLQHLPLESLFGRGLSRGWSMVSLHTLSLGMHSTSMHKEKHTWATGVMAAYRSFATLLWTVSSICGMHLQVLANTPQTAEDYMFCHAVSALP